MHVDCSWLDSVPVSPLVAVTNWRIRPTTSLMGDCTRKSGASGIQTEDSAHFVWDVLEESLVVFFCYVSWRRENSLDVGLGRDLSLPLAISCVSQLDFSPLMHQEDDLSVSWRVVLCRLRPWLIHPDALLLLFWTNARYNYSSLLYRCHACQVWIQRCFLLLLLHEYLLSWLGNSNVGWRRIESLKLWMTFAIRVIPEL